MICDKSGPWQHNEPLLTWLRAYNIGMHVGLPRTSNTRIVLLVHHHVLIDPLPEVGDATVNARVASRLTTVTSPACRTCQVHLTVHLARQWATRVTLSQQ